MSLVKFSYWSKFHVNIMSSSGVMTIFIYKGLTGNLEIGNTLVWILSCICRLGWVRDTKFGTNVSNKILLNAIKCRDYSLYRSWVITEKPTGAYKNDCIWVPIKKTILSGLKHDKLTSFQQFWNVQSKHFFSMEKYNLLCVKQFTQSSLNLDNNLRFTVDYPCY